MRTGIYVHSTTALTLASGDSTIEISKYPDAGNPITVSTNPVTLDPGVYRILSSSPVDVVGSGVGTVAEVVALSGDKDPWPIPPASVAQLVGRTQQEVADFFLTKAIADI